VVTDASPDLTDLRSFVDSATSRWGTTEQKVWALYYWTHILKRQANPIVLHGFEVTDPIRNFNDFGFTMCSTISGINQTLYETLGLQHQFWDICNHTVSQVYYNGKFHVIAGGRGQRRPTCERAQPLFHESEWIPHGRRHGEEPDARRQPVGRQYAGRLRGRVL
jgi:hypothetical protein